MATLESARLNHQPKQTPNDAAEPSRLQFMLRALQYRNYRLFFSGQIVSLLGTWMTQIATSWLVYRLTNSPLMLGAVSFAGQLPAFLLAPIAGVVVDRVNKHRLIVINQILAMLQSFGLAFMTFTGHVSIESIIALMAVQGFINAFDMPARQSFVIEMIENKADLSNAIGLNSSMFNTARLLGPSIGGVIVVAAGEKWCFLLDGFSYIAVIAGLLMMQVKPHVRKAERRNPLHELNEGFRYAFGFAPIRSILLLMAAMSLVAMPYAVLLPVVAKAILHGNASTQGFLIAASGTGALGAGLTLAARKSVVGLGRLIPYSTLAFSAAVLALSHTTVLWLALPLLFIMGFAMMQQNAACNTIVQTIVDNDKRGRVMSMYTMAVMGLAPFGSLVAGFIAQRIGVPDTLLICGLGSFVAGIVFLLNLRTLQQAIRPIYQRLGIIPEVTAAVEVANEMEPVKNAA